MRPFLRKHPFFFVTIVFIGGIVMARSFFDGRWIHVFFMIGLFCFLLSLGLFAISQSVPRISLLHSALIYISLVFFGASAYLQRLPDNQPAHFQNLKLANEYVPALVRVEKMEKNRLLCNVLLLDKQRVHGSILVYHRDVSLDRGDLLLCHLKIQPIAGPRNPFAFSFKKFYANKHIYQQGAIKGKPVVVARGAGLIHAFSRWRGRCKSLLQKNLSQEEYALCSALLLGDKSELAADQKEAFADTGAMHVLAVSGLHVGVVYMIVLFFLKLFRFPGFFWRFVRSVMALGTIWFFVYLVGAPTSAWRAACMFSLFEVGMLSARSSYPINTLSFAAFVLLVVDPNTVFDVGFQLSFLAVLGIVTCQRPVQQLLQIENPVGFKMWQLTSLSISAQIFTLPLTIFYFHQFPIAFLISGLFAVFLASVILTLGLLYFLFHALPFLGFLLGNLVACSAFCLNKCIVVLDSIPGLVWESLWLSPLQVTLLCVVSTSVALFLNHHSGRNFKWFLFSLVLFLFSTNYSTVKKMKESYLVFYHDTKGAYVDFIHRRTSYPIIESDSIVPRDIETTRMALGVKTIGSWRDLSTIYFNAGFFSFGSHRTFFPDSIPPSEVALPPVENIFIRDMDAQLDFEGVPDSLQFILASALPGRGRHLERGLQNQGTAYHNISTQGGLILDLTR